MQVRLEKLERHHALLISDVMRSIKEEAEPWKDATLSIGLSEDFFRRSASDKKMIFYVAVDHDTTRVVGFSKAHINHTYFGPDLVCEEYTLYVMPEYRGFGFGARMARLTKKSFDANGIKHAVICNTTGIDQDVYARVATNIFGLKEVGAVYK